MGVAFEPVQDVLNEWVGVPLGEVGAQVLTHEPLRLLEPRPTKEAVFDKATVLDLEPTALGRTRREEVQLAQRPQGPATP